MEYSQEVKVSAEKMFDIFEKSYLDDIYRITGNQLSHLSKGYSYKKRVGKGIMDIKINEYSKNEVIGCIYTINGNEVISSYKCIRNENDSCKVVITEIVNNKDQKELSRIGKFMAMWRFKKQSKSNISGIEKHILKGNGE